MESCRHEDDIVFHTLSVLLHGVNYLLLKETQMFAELESLKSQVAASLSVESAAVSKVKAQAQQIVDLQAQLTAAQAASVTDADKADLVKATSDLKASGDALASA